MTKETTEHKDNNCQPQQTPPTQPWEFQKLTPYDGQDLNIYKDAFEFVFNNQDLRNIAISGPFGCGKSSLVLSYEKQNLKKKFLHITLGQFNPSPDATSAPNQSETNDTASTDKKEQEKIKQQKEFILEGKIINQLIHQIEPNKIDQTDFKIKQDKYKSKSCLITAAISLFLLLCCTFNATFITKVIQPLWDLWLAFSNISVSLSILQSIRSIALLILFIYFCTGIYHVIHAQRKHNILKKIKLQNNEIEIREENNDSYFDKYLNEVLYLFTHAKAEVIVFEDIDRFNNHRIFERLREINNLVNKQLELLRSSEQTKLLGWFKKLVPEKWQKKYQSQPLRFFYLLRDDIFDSPDQAKFFDFTISVIPVINSANSYTSLLDLFIYNQNFQNNFKNQLHLYPIDKVFLSELSLYINDMRLLKKTFNDFVIYFKRLNSNKPDEIILNPNNLLALIYYKQLFPYDFNLLQINQGYIYTVFQQKHKLISKETQELIEKIKKNKELITAISNETLQSKSELEKIYNRQNSTSYFRSLNSLSPEEERREQLIEYKNNNRIQKLEKEIEEAENQLTQLSSLTLHNLLNRKNISDYLVKQVVWENELKEYHEFLIIKGNPYFELLKFLLKRGYIDENYQNYLSYFSPDTLTQSDKNFLLSIANESKLPYDYKLDNLEKIQGRLEIRIDNFNQIEILNFALLNYLLEQKSEKYNQYLKQIIHVITRNNKRDFVLGFIQRYVKKDPNSEKWIRLINTDRNNDFYKQYNYDIFTDSQPVIDITFRDYSHYLLTQLSKFEYSGYALKYNFENYFLKHWISSQNDYLNLPNHIARNKNSLEIIKNGLRILKVSFKEINTEHNNPDLLEFVYQQNLYHLNFANICLMLRTQYSCNNESDLLHKNFTLIQTQPDSDLKHYIDKHINEYITEVLKHCKQQIDDDKEAAQLILHHPKIKPELKAQYQQYLTTPI